MLLIPAIDLKAGQCVRLRQGLMEESTVFSDDPVATAARWVDAGAQRLHLVDLDGAFAGKPQNKQAIQAICEAFPELPIQVGGGIRTTTTIESYLDKGVDYVIIGSQAVRDPNFVSEACRAFPDRVIVGLDVKAGQIAIDGWSTLSKDNAIEFAKRLQDQGVVALVFTDISRDGMLQGVNTEATAALAREVNIPVIASGGVSTLDDIKALYNHIDDGILGAILGRALYQGTLDLAAAQQWINTQTNSP